MLTESKRLEKEIDTITKKIEELPKGKISISHTGKYTKWYHIIDKAKSLISKKNRMLASQLATKKYLVYLKSDLEQEKNAIDFILDITKWRIKLIFFIVKKNTKN